MKLKSMNRTFVVHITNKSKAQISIKIYKNNVCNNNKTVDLCSNSLCVYDRERERER